MQAAEMVKNTTFCPWWPRPWHSNSSKQGTNTFSLWIWCKSVRRFPRYFTHKQKSHRQRQKQNLMQFTGCGNYTKWCKNVFQL